MEEEIKTMVNKQFGSLTVVKPSMVKSSDDKPKMVCKCSCGTIVTVSVEDLKNNNFEECHFKQEPELNENEQINRFKIISIRKKSSHYNDTEYLCRCKCGTNFILTYEELIDDFNDCDCIEFYEYIWNVMKNSSTGVIDEWEDFNNFVSYIDENETYEGNYVRIDLSEPFGPDNILWIPPEEAALSVRRKYLIEKYKDLIGTTFGYLTITNVHGNINSTSPLKFSCKCSCGNIKKVEVRDVLNNKIDSCGCISHYREIWNKILEESDYKVDKDWKDFNDFIEYVNNNEIYDGEFCIPNISLPIGPTNILWIPSGKTKEIVLKEYNNNLHKNKDTVNLKEQFIKKYSNFVHIKFDIITVDKVFFFATQTLEKLNNRNTLLRIAKDYLNIYIDRESILVDKARKMIESFS